MFGNRFYNQLTRKYVALFGTLFNDIKIARVDGDSNFQFAMDVPINYGPMQKFLARLEQDPNFKAPAMTLPRMSFEITNMTYDGSRKLTNALTNAITSTDKNILRSQYTPAPYNLDFQLNIMTKYSEDGAKILEQILPFFKPEQTLSVKLIDPLDAYFDVPVILNSITTEDSYEGDFETRRALIWTLNFTVKGYFFGPVSDKKVVKFVRANIFDDMNDVVDTRVISSTSEEIIGEDANGDVGVIDENTFTMYFDDFANGESFGVSNTESNDRLTGNTDFQFTLGQVTPDINIRLGDTLNIVNESDDFSLVIIDDVIDPQTGAFGFSTSNVVDSAVANGMPAISGGTIKFKPTSSGEYYYISPENADFAGIIFVENVDVLLGGSVDEVEDPDADIPDIPPYVNYGDLPSSIVEVTPGLNSSGQGTKDPNETVHYSDIDWDDDWDYIVEITDGDDYRP